MCAGTGILALSARIFCLAYEDAITGRNLILIRNRFSANSSFGSRRSSFAHNTPEWRHWYTARKMLRTSVFFFFFRTVRSCISDRFASPASCSYENKVRSGGPSISLMYSCFLIFFLFTIYSISLSVLTVYSVCKCPYKS